MSHWSKYKDYINSVKIGDNITRKESNKVVYKTIDKWNYATSQGNTVDYYRRTLCHLGILTYIDRGIYRVNYHIKPETTSFQIKKAVWPRMASWKYWFIPNSERLKFIIQE